MKNKDIIACGASLYRVLNVVDGTMFVMDCLSPKMPYWISIAEADCKHVTEQELYERTGKSNVSLDNLDAVRRRVALNRYTIIAGVLPFLTDANLRANVIKRLANEHNLSAQTIRNYLYEYLIYQNTAVLAPKAKDKDKKLTPDQKNIRWALNKFFYTKNNNSLNTAYMVRVDVFTKVMQIIKFAKSQGQNIRLISLGDFAQLRPVVTLADIEILKMLYPDIKGYYAFHSPLWEDAHFEKIILHNVKRQKETEFVEHLEGIKYGRLTDLEWVMKNASPFLPAKPVYICSKRKTVDDFNRSALEEFGEEHNLTTYQAKHNGPLSEELPCPEKLSVGIGVRVLCCCNDKHYKNGMVGTVKSFDEDKIIVVFDNGKSATIRRKTFILENGTEYKQFPLTLGYAITTHKAQGSTFSSVAIVCDGYFEAGQLYCALSRCPNLNNLTFIGELEPSDLIVNAEALKITVYS